MNKLHTVNTQYGDVSGIETQKGILTFKGIPYAAPPVGANRFQPPLPPTPWTDVKNTTEYGPTAPQLTPTSGPFAELLPNVVIPGDDYLNLNIWTSGITGKKPVMVFIHGGAFVVGSGAVPGYDGSNFARDGVVLVTINYRLGVEGFLWFGDGVPNLGMLDQIAALKWVRDNIANFGGDPDNVTIFGESAGGMSVCTLLAMKEAQGLFRRAIAESGAGHSAISASSAKLIAARLAEILDVAPTREAVGEVSAEKIFAAQDQLGAEIMANPSIELWGEAAFNLMPFEPVIDGHLLTATPIECISNGAAKDVDILIGTNSQEFRLFLLPDGILPKITATALHRAASAYGLSAKAIQTYQTNRPDSSPGDVLSAIITDWFYHIPALRIAEKHRNTHVYEFSWGSPACDNLLGACHGIELAFVFDNLSDPGYAEMIGNHPPQELADTVHKAWVNFATHGNPGWDTYDVNNRVSMRFDVVSQITTDDRADERSAWDGIR
ncbi:carboxylesterase/lipase family protein [Elizabethkingia meningoseptica]|uniref:carboxylesterase/lipase family protein n=1 Tax=Elizabethkingia meningoseptica TaxID=238 RepID=UPI002012378E|nr:carboxylesterase family protein [Elizabethkingia meningoseptica]MCL1674537.1 carboxylesterase family protein [Elizabethkingia meningoseptica]MCL1686264.1 carboxylesterase family protein [Elizabethkingia meningoseptica]